MGNWYTTSRACQKPGISVTHALPDGHHLQGTRFEDLSQDVVLNVLSRLCLRDVVNFSATSKQWLHVTCYMDKIEIDIQMTRKRLCPEDTEAFIEGANQFLLDYFKKRSMIALPIPLRIIVIFFCFNRRHSTYIDRWIKMAIDNGITGLVVIPQCAIHVATTRRYNQERYVFPWQKLHSSPKLLKGLCLKACIFQCSLNSRWVSLETIQLVDTTLTEDDFNKFFYRFPSLRILHIHYCQVPRRVSMTSTSLTFLGVLYCSNLDEIDLLGATALTEFQYKGNCVNFKNISSPMLTNLSLGFFDVKGDEYVFQNLHLDTVQSLSINRDFEQQVPKPRLLGRMSSFARLEELKLFSHPGCGLSHQAMTEMLKACPILKRLEMVPPCATNAVNETGCHVDRHFHKCLRFIHIRGFCGSRGNVELAKFLLQVSEELHQVIVERKIKGINYMYSRHSEDWHGQQKPKVIKDMFLKLSGSARFTFL